MGVQAYRTGTKIISWYVSLLDQLAIAQTRTPHVPPLPLRRNVQGEAAPQAFLDLGHRSRRDIAAALESIGRHITDFTQVLDFGCGCGRTLRWFDDVPASTQFFGTDVNPDAIAWCRQHLTFASFRVNQMLPPLDYPDNTFDFVYALSVFTHLTEEQQFLWMAELKRIMQPNGLILLTFLGYDPHDTQSQTRLANETVRGLHPALSALGKGGPWSELGGPWGRLNRDALETLQRLGIVSLPYPPTLQLFFPDGYVDTFHTKTYIEHHFGKHFHLISYLPKGMTNFLDVTIMQKP